jgi:hypothetical protein
VAPPKANPTPPPTPAAAPPAPDPIGAIAIVIDKINAQLEDPTLPQTQPAKYTQLQTQHDQLVTQQQDLLEAELNADDPQFVTLTTEITTATKQLNQQGAPAASIDAVLQTATKVAAVADQLLKLVP